jgi:hypothetical protein
MGKCIVSISNKMQRHTVYLYLETLLHVSGGTSTRHQERIKLYLQHLVFVTPLLLSDTFLCAPDYGWKYHPKHVEQFPNIHKLCNDASFWIYIGILLGAHPLLHISRINVKLILHFHLEWRLRMGGATPPSSIDLTVRCLIEGHFRFYNRIRR